jgi:hypothetical protein
MISSGSRSRLKEEKQRAGKTRDHIRKQEARSKENSLLNRAFLWDAAFLGLFAFVHGFGVFSSEDRGGDEVMDECASGFAGHLSKLFY